MIKITSFDKNHLEEAQKIAAMNYSEERIFVSSLPDIAHLPGLEHYAENNLGVAAIGDNKLLGYLCWHNPWDGLFGTVKGTCSDVHMNGAVKENRAEIYDRLYQAAAEIWVAGDVFSHCVILYEHNEEANLALAQNGFGRRCVDAIRETTSIDVPVIEDVTYRQANIDDTAFITMMGDNTGIHLSKSPIFMPYSRPAPEDNIEDIENHFIALLKGRPVAYLYINDSGETFASKDASVMNICGANALPEARGKGISAGLLSWLMDWLRECGYSRCGVDYEIFNPTARKFWAKYFTPYTNGAVRRIDERINHNKAHAPNSTKSAINP